jgi:hypothetical protein
MNASDFSRLRKGAIFNTHNSASSIAVMGETSRFFGSIAMTSSGKKRTFAAKKCGALLSFCFVGRNPSGAILANLFPRFWRTAIATKFLKQVAMSFPQMFCLRKAFKVVGAVVGFIPVYVVDMFAKAKTLKPTSCHNAVHKPVPQTQITFGMVCGGVRLQLSDSFSTARNCVKMVKESVLGSFYRDANHVVPQFCGYGIFILTDFKE